MQPDGTIVEREVVSENNNTAGAVSSIEQASYKVGVSVNPLDYKDIRAEMGARLGKLPLWLEAGYEAKHKSVDVGLSLEF